MKVFKGHGALASIAVISLCDYSGNWPRPWNEAGYTVLCYDLKHGDDVTKLTPERILSDAYAEGCDDIVGVLAAPPCTDFAVSGAQYWREKDADGRTERSLEVLDACVDICEFFNRRYAAWWALENPVGRIPKLRPDLGAPRAYFQPYRFAHLSGKPLDEERYTKKTGLWGVFNVDGMRALEQENGGPIRVCSQGSWIQRLGGKSERTKELRSMTPMGLARAFYVANVQWNFNAKEVEQ